MQAATANIIYTSSDHLRVMHIWASPPGVERVIDGSDWALSPYQVWGPLDHPITFIWSSKEKFEVEFFFPLIFHAIAFLIVWYDTFSL